MSWIGFSGYAATAFVAAATTAKAAISAAEILLYITVSFLR
jgi:hypothetical protein